MRRGEGVTEGGGGTCESLEDAEERGGSETGSRRQKKMRVERGTEQNSKGKQERGRYGVMLLARYQ